MQKDGVLRIVLADDHSLIRHGIKNLIAKDNELLVVGEVSNGEELLDYLKCNEVDMVILDNSMHKISGVEAARHVKKMYPWIKILMLTMHDNQQIFYNAMISGADGYLLKEDSDDQLLIAIEKLKAGKKYISPSMTDDFTHTVVEMYRGGKKKPYYELSKRELEILQLVVKGYTSKKMAECLGLSPRTIDHHRSNILKKMGKKNSVDLVNFVVRNGFVTP
jgi:DNA-binding NarL/FixJ family response regulator